MQGRPKIGISACFMHPDPARVAFAKKTLQYVERSMAQWILNGGALPVMIPSSGSGERDDLPASDPVLAEYAAWLDGLVLHGGADVWPGSYGESPLKAAWQGDRIRDEYEIALVHAFVTAGKPVFGVCRGLQLINVAFGGTLFQDIETQKADALVHRNADAYDHNFHALSVVPGTRMADLLGQAHSNTINSIHHQAIKTLALGFVVEAHSPADGVIEAIRLQSAFGEPPVPYVAAVQWHPEFHRTDLKTLDDSPLLRDFLAAARATSDLCRA